MSSTREALISALREAIAYIEVRASEAPEIAKENIALLSHRVAVVEKAKESEFQRLFSKWAQDDIDAGRWNPEEEPS